MNEISEFLEANYIPAIKAAGNDKDLNEVLFKTVNYLLETRIRVEQQHS